MLSYSRTSSFSSVLSAFWYSACLWVILWEAAHFVLGLVQGFEATS
jgi:hypothetical protein